MPHTQPQKLFGAGVFATFKPVLWFVKGHRRILPSGQRPLMTDEFISPRRDKLAHEWAQGEGGVWVPIEHLSEPGDLIVFPFAGTCTWIRIAAMMGRRALGCDIAPGGTTTIAA
jgi:DNA modification methylase